MANQARRRYPCEKCGATVPARDLAPVLMGKQTHSSPADYSAWCRTCRGWDDERDPVYERAAAKFDDSEGQRDWR